MTLSCHIFLYYDKMLLCHTTRQLTPTYITFNYSDYSDLNLK